MPDGTAPSAAEIDLTILTISSVQKGLAAGLFTAEQLCRAHFERIDKYEPFYNAFTFLLKDEALETARAIDAHLAAGEKIEDMGKLAGVPVVIKEAMDMAGKPQTCGWKPLAPPVGGAALIPERDAPVVARVRKAGAVILGRTNIPEFSNDGSRANSSWDGPTFNAVERSVLPGASTAGTATAVAAAFCVVGLAEETGGSIQNPASAQSLIGIKPTFALVPNSGVVPLAGSTRDVVGPHARNVTDAAIVLDVLAGYTPEDPKTVAGIGKIPEGGYTSKLSETSLNGARIGLYGSGWRTKPLHPETEKLYKTAVAELEARGAVLVDDPFNGTGFSDIAAPSTGFFDSRGVEAIIYDLQLYLDRLGPSAAAKTVDEFVKLAGKDPLGSGETLAIYKDHPVLQASLKDPRAPPDLSEFLAAKTEYIKVFNKVMDDNKLDALAFPQTESPLPGIFSDDYYPAATVSEINIAGLPGVTVPAGQYSNGGPFALIFVGRHFSEAELLSFAYDYEQATKHRIVPVLAEEPCVEAK